VTEQSRIALGIEYDGRSFSGWQMQTNRRTVQKVIEQAVSLVANESIRVVCAGRTDAGVHAIEQVVHFDTQARREIHAWVLGSNSNLPRDVRVLWARQVDSQFNARSSAIARYYRYVILNRRTQSALYRDLVTWCYAPLDLQRMIQASGYLLGEHDFSSYRAKHCQSNSPIRIMHIINLSREKDRVIMDVVGNAFLHHMVRNIAGVLMEIGCGKREPFWAKEVLDARDRAVAGVTAPPHGLYLGGVYYPKSMGIKKHPIFNTLPVNVKRIEAI